MRKTISGWLLKLMGWTVDSGIVPEKKCIILGAPHTSSWDFVVAFLYYNSKGGGSIVKCMVKKSLFFPIFGSILRAMGGIPVDRKNSAAMVHSVIKEIERADTFHLAIAPEGTRKPVRRWKTGFHLIAKTAGIPVYLAYFDWGAKHVGYFAKVELTDDAKADMERIQQMYDERHLVGKHPEKYVAR